VSLTAALDGVADVGMPRVIEDHPQGNPHDYCNFLNDCT